MKKQVIVPVVHIGLYGVPLNDKEFLWVQDTSRGIQPKLVAPIEFMDIVFAHSDVFFEQVETQGTQGVQGR